MPKMTKDFPEQINILAPEGTMVDLKSISYYQGTKGHYADPARDLIREGITRWIESLTPTERKRFESIRETVRASEAIRRQD